MEALIAEMNKIRELHFSLDFRYPSADEIQKLKRIHRDLGADEQEKINRDIEGMKSILERISEGDISVDSLPPDLQDLLRSLRVEN